jgi:RNA polymerase sigma factor (TIGR02999 family)
MLKAAGSGDDAAAARLWPLVYEELRALAHAKMARQASGHTLQTTALVHEAYLKLVGSGDPEWEGRAHFFGAAAQAMRQILIDQARRKARAKHGGELHRVDLDDVTVSLNGPAPDLLALDEALRALETIDLRKAKLVELRYFGGLSMEEVERDWRYVKVWLYDRLQ